MAIKYGVIDMLHLPLPTPIAIALTLALAMVLWFPWKTTVVNRTRAYIESLA